MPIKSIHITNYYHPNSGGISRAYDKLLAAADRHRRFVRLIVPGPKTTVSEVGEYARIYFVEAGHAPVFDKRYRLLLPWKTYWKEDSPIRKILDEEKPDMIEIGEKYTLSLMAGLIRRESDKSGSGRPMLVNASCERMDDNFRSFISDAKVFEWFAKGYMSSYLVPMFDFHLANSDYTAEEIIRAETRFDLVTKIWKAPKLGLTERVFVNQRGVNGILFTPDRKAVEQRKTINQEFDLPDDSVILIYAGRLSPEKNVGLLPEMMKHLAAETDRDFRLLIAGDGPSLEMLERESAKLGPGSVIFLGHLTDRQRLADLYANCDVFVHPNPREPFGQAPLEAMASGLPVVAPDAGGIRSYADDSNAWLTSADPGSFAAAVRKICDDPVGRRTRIASALETARQYSWERSTDRAFTLYDEMHSIFTHNRQLFDVPRQG